ncbi:MAG: hypothetical protein AABX35_01675 [Nanoarchaeota archaeon]
MTNTNLKLKQPVHDSRNEYTFEGFDNLLRDYFGGRKGVKPEELRRYADTLVNRTRARNPLNRYMISNERMSVKTAVNVSASHYMNNGVHPRKKKELADAFSDDFWYWQGWLK